MTAGISSIGGVPRITAAAASVPDAVREALIANQQAEDELVRDALTQLGEPTPAPMPVKPRGRTNASVGGRRPIHVPVGSMVMTGPGPQDTWTLVGTSGDQVRLAQRTPNGSIRRTERPWASIVERNARFVDTPIVDATGVKWFPHAATGVSELGRRAPTRIATIEYVNSKGLTGAAATTTWDDVLRATELTRRRPIAAAPARELDVANLRALLGDEMMVVSKLGDAYGAAPALIGTDSAPARGAATIDDAIATQHWFSQRAGLDIWERGRATILYTDSPEHVANAAAGAAGDLSIAFEGPRSERVRGSMLEPLTGDEGQITRRISKLLAAHDVGVRTHEGGHVAQMRAWGDPEQRLASVADHRVLTEDGIVGEAFSDLFGGARVGKPTVGVRELGRLTNGTHTLDALRAGIDAMPPGQFDEHAGTQLLTKPMVRVQSELGHDAHAEISGAAVRRIGLDIHAGRVTSVDLPTAARALRDATAWRHGADSAVVQHLDDAWRMLRVLR